jgi:diguanylate cyclase (GGDEF)-like protein
MSVTAASLLAPSGVGRPVGLGLLALLLIGLWRHRRVAAGGSAEGWRLLELAALLLVVSHAIDDSTEIGNLLAPTCGVASLAFGLLGVGRRLRAQTSALALDAIIESSIVSFVGGGVIWMLVVQPRVDLPAELPNAALYTGFVVLATVVAMSIAWLAAVEPMSRLGGAMVAVFALAYVADWGMRLATEVGAHLPAGFEIGFACLALVAATAAATVASPSAPLQPDDIAPVFRRRLVVVATGAGPLLTAIALADRHRSSWAGVLAAAAVLAVLEVVYLLRLFGRRGHLERLAQRDDLTDLPNRRHFDRRLREAHALAQVTDASLSVALIDLDRFKVVNDNMGHAAGDQLLRGAARRIARSVGDNSMVARIGGDEFAVIVVGARRDAVLSLAQGIIHGFEAPFDVLDREVFITPSIGIAHFPDDGNDPGELLRSADVAMYGAKARGRNLVHEAAGSPDRLVDRVSLETDLRHAVERGELVIHYQPRIDLLSGSIVGAEALVRWNHPHHGLLPPDDFIPLAEEAGLIGVLGEWVLQHACVQGAAWHDLTPEFTMAVNVSARQFENDQLPTVVAAALRSSRLAANSLELELTESLALQDPDHVAALLTELRDMDVRCSIDDFGTGYSGLHYLDRFPITAIKIDRSFLLPVSSERPGSAIVSAMIALARGLGIEVVAEGVENRDQADFLVGEGCDQAQGYYYGHPLPAADFEHMLVESITTAEGGRTRPTAAIPATLASILGSER